MVLKKQNINEWLTALNKIMLEKYRVDDYANTVSQDEWLETYEGATVEDAIRDEVSHWEE